MTIIFDGKKQERVSKFKKFKVESIPQQDLNLLIYAGKSKKEWRHNSSILYEDHVAKQSPFLPTFTNLICY